LNATHVLLGPGFYQIHGGPKTAGGTDGGRGSLCTAQTKRRPLPPPDRDPPASWSLRLGMKPSVPLGETVCEEWGLAIAALPDTPLPNHCGNIRASALQGSSPESRRECLWCDARGATRTWRLDLLSYSTSVVKCFFSYFLSFKLCEIMQECRKHSKLRRTWYVLQVYIPLA
jgi:hypothetical protein